jgi:hypothetical protein
MKISKEKQNVMVGIGMGTVMVIIAIYFVVIRAQGESLATASKAIADKEVEVNKAKAAIATAKVLLDDLMVITNRLSKDEIMMAPANDKLAWFVGTLSTFTAKYQNQVNIPHKSQPQVTPVMMYSSFPYASATFPIRGDAFFHQIGRFVSDLENQYPFFRIQRLQLSPAGADISDVPERLGFEIEITTLTPALPTP